jgi:hypothetical protein
MQLAFALTERVSVAEGTWVEMEVAPLTGWGDEEVGFHAQTFFPLFLRRHSAAREPSPRPSPTRRGSQCLSGGQRKVREIRVRQTAGFHQPTARGVRSPYRGAVR